MYIHAYCMYVKRASLYDVVYKNNLGRIHLVQVGPEHNIRYDTNTIFTCLGRRIDTVEKWIILTWNIKIKKMCFVPHRICCYMQQGYTMI